MAQLVELGNRHSDAPFTRDVPEPFAPMQFQAGRGGPTVTVDDVGGLLIFDALGAQSAGDKIADVRSDHLLDIATQTRVREIIEAVDQFGASVTRKMTMHRNRITGLDRQQTNRQQAELSHAIAKQTASGIVDALRAQMRVMLS